MNRETARFAAALSVAIGLALTAIAPRAAETQVTQQPAAQAVPEAQKGTFLLTVFLRHDQSKTLGEINDHLKQTGYYKKFPPQGIEVVSWYVMMGIGQVVTLRVPAERLREVNRALEESAWGGYRTEFYPTYDYKAIAEHLHQAAQ